MTSFVLKIIAAVTMLIDHAGLILFPQYRVFRIIGRIAFPLYAYCIAEGFRYTKNRLNYFLRIFVLGALCQIVYTIVDRQLYIGILLTFSMSIVVMACLECVRSASNGEKSAVANVIEKISGKTISNSSDRIVSLVCTAVVILAVFSLCMSVNVDYGFFGVMLPVFTNLFPDKTRRFVMFSASLLALCIDMTSSSSIQYWSLLTIPLIAAYNGKPGKYRLKYFFYIFYPLHLVILYGISMIV